MYHVLTERRLALRRKRAEVMTAGDTVDDPFRTGKAYTIGQAAALTKVTPKTIRNWVYGYEGHTEPVFGGKDRAAEEVAQVSFLELAEIAVVARFRRQKIKLDRIRRAHAYARQELFVPFPFASLKLTTLGGHVLHEYEERDPGEGRFTVLSAPGQYVLPNIVQEELKHFEFDGDPFVVRWYPYGKEVPVVIDPRRAGGAPTIDGRSVTLDIIRKRWMADEPIASIAHDYELKPPLVEAVLRRVFSAAVLR